MLPERIARVTAIVALLVVLTSAAGGEVRPIGLLGALGREVALLDGEITSRQEHEIEGLRFLEGDLRGRRVVLARTGVGKVNAAMVAVLLLEHFRPRAVIFTGVAGGIGPDLCVGDIVVAERTAQHDLGTLRADGFERRGMRNPVDGRRNPVYFPADPGLLAQAVAASARVTLEAVGAGPTSHVPRVLSGVVVTGDMFVSSRAKKGELRLEMQADAVEMEGAAVAQICWQQGVPCLVIRSISDLADETASEDFDAFVAVAARNSATLVATMVEVLVLR